MKPIHKVNEEHGLITIYGNHGCSACVIVDRICNERAINYVFIDRNSNDIEQNAIINRCEGIPEKDYQYIPVIISSNNKFLGGSTAFIKLVNGN
jgi:glutaredoxin